MKLNQPVTWKRHSTEPVLPNGPAGSFDEACAMNPYVVTRGDEWWLYYAGATADEKRRICLATAKIGDVENWTRHGPVMDVGEPGSFDQRWCVLPHVVEVDGRWLLYYTANCGVGEGLAAFPGLGLAESVDGRTFTRVKDEPILAPSHVDGDPDAIGMAGGSVINAKLPDGRTEWRHYYTGCPTVGKELMLNQQKTICYATSKDAVHWEKQGCLMRRIDDRDYENVGVAGPVVQQEEGGSYRMWYSAIGTRWDGKYGICYAEPEDGLTWRRGEAYGDNLQLTRTGDGWEKQMVEYPGITRDNDGRLWLFYCGNGYGRTGIGAAVAEEG